MMKLTPSLHAPYISIVIPVHNEQENLEELYTRLTSTLDKLGKSYEIILTNDGSTDRTAEMLAELHARRPKQIRVIEFNGNFGQHMAIMAGFERVRGQIIITMDADLQDNPAEIPNTVFPPRIPLTSTVTGSLLPVVPPLPSWPDELVPQAKIDPSKHSARQCDPPAATATTSFSDTPVRFTAAGMPEPLPQSTTDPSEHSARLRKPPAEIATTVFPAKAPVASTVTGKALDVVVPSPS